MVKGNDNNYTDSDYLKFWAMMSSARIKKCIESSKTPDHLIACDKLVSLFRKSYLQAGNYSVCDAELQFALQNKRIEIQYLSIPPAESYRSYLR